MNNTETQSTTTTITRPVPPKDLAGYQQVIYGRLEAGDLIAHENSDWIILIGTDETVGCPITDGKFEPVWRKLTMDQTCRIYRIMPVPSRADDKADRERMAQDNAAIQNELLKFQLQSIPQDYGTALGQSISTATTTSRYSIPGVAKPDKALTYDDGKPPLAMVPLALLRGVAEVQAYGHKKYGDYHNFRKGLEVSRQLSCVLRHAYAYQNGDDLDPESKLSHLKHAACRLGFLLQNLEDGVAVDDRYKK